MKIYLFITIFSMSHLLAFGAITDKELHQFKSNLKIGGVRTATWKDKNRKKFELLEVNTFQSEDDPLNYDMSRFRIRLIVELIDKQKKTYLVKYTGNAPEYYDSEYQGEDYWNLYVAYGDMGRLKISGYLVQFGIMDDGNFVSLAEEQDNIDEVLERVRERTTALFAGKVYLRHYYMYDDSSEGVTESAQSNIKLIKE